MEITVVFRNDTTKVTSSCGYMADLILPRPKTAFQLTAGILYYKERGAM